MNPLLFPGLRPASLESEPTATADADPPTGAVEDRQLRLFSDLAVLRRDLECAVADGDFEEARRVCRLARETFGPGGPSWDFAFLEALGPELWEQPPGKVLARWQEIDQSLANRPVLRSGVRDGVFCRLLRRDPAATLGTERPDLVGTLCAALTSLDRESGPASARALVRDLLLEAREIHGSQLTHDAAVAALLAEHLSPVWLACLGALRRLWPAPALSPAELASFALQPFSPPTSDEAAAREFWTCLRVARTPEPPEALLHEARRRMKRLNPEMHALHMRRAEAQ